MVPLFPADNRRGRIPYLERQVSDSVSKKEFALGSNKARSYFRQERVRDPALTTMLAIQCLVIFAETFAMMGHACRFIWYFIPNSPTNIPEGAAWQAYGTILYSSFLTLTSTGYGNVTPVYPFVRTLANVEATIGQLYPATLLARLITLELRTHRRQPAPSGRKSGSSSTEEEHHPDQGHHPVMPHR